jgi:solute carrier family 66, member 2
MFHHMWWLYQLVPKLTTLRCSYWQFLLYLFISLAVLELLLGPFKSVYPTYSALVGYVGLTVEATLALPQLYANAQSQSCKGFRVSILASWLLGDALKMFWFFTSPTAIPWAFKLCGIFQAMSDLGLGVQFLMYGDGEPDQRAMHNQFRPHLSGMNGGRTLSGGGSPFRGEKRY